MPSNPSNPNEAAPSAPVTTADAPVAPSAPSRWQRWRKPLVEALALVAVILVIRAVQARTLVTGRAPSVVTRALDGAEARVGSASSQAHVLWFFATWCTVCRASEHNIAALSGNPNIILVASDSGSAESVRAFARARGIDRLRIINDEDGALARRFGVRSFPTTFAIASDGSIRSTDVGYSSELGLRWRLFRAGL